MTALSAPQTGISELTLGNLWINVDGYQVALDDEDIYLSSGEFEFLRMLAQRADHIVPFEELANEIFDNAERKSLRHLNVLVHRLRAKLSTLQPYVIKTVPRRGYGLVRPAAMPRPHQRMAS
jgi:DNA-binding response OmpR family regulator